MLTKLKVALAVGAIALGVTSTTASATIVTIFDGVAAGETNFDNTVNGAGGTVSTDVWTGITGGVTSIDRGDYTITRNDGSGLSFGNEPGMSAPGLFIDPNGTFGGPRTAPLDYKPSGVTFTFDNPVNSIGFEVGDWATCCFDPTTDLFIQFDNAAPILVASADEASDGLFPNQDNPSIDAEAIFVAAFDDTDSFTTVSFWGNGSGEVLFAGGQVKYALLGQGTLPPSVVPLPAAGFLLLAGLGGLGLMRRRQKAA